MGNYRLRLVSLRNTLFALILLPSVLFITELLLFPKINSELLQGLVIVAFFVPGYFVWQKLVISVTEWIIDKDGVKIHWLKQFGPDKQDDFSAGWDNIESFTAAERQQSFSITLSNGRLIKFNHDRLAGNDDYTAFTKAFKQTLNAIKGC